MPSSAGTRIVLAVAFLVSVAGVTQAQDPSDPPASSHDAPVVLDDGSRLWFVELSQPPAADGGDPASIEREHAGFRESASAMRLRFTESGGFKSLWNGLAIVVHPDDVEKLERLAGVQAVYPIVSLEVPDLEEIAQPELSSALSMTGADVAQSQLGLTGAGVRVGIIDTGIDYDHPDLGGDGVARVNSGVFPTARVVAGWDFVGVVGFPPAPDPYPDDEHGHGTHVAGIVGANGLVRGVAPNVVFGAYRVGGSTDQVLAAMERALADGMQIVNISMGAALQWPKYPTAQAANRLVQKGVIVTASMGNNGALGLYGGSGPGVGEKVIGVGSFDNTFRNFPAFTVSPDRGPFAFTSAVGAPPPPRTGTFPLAYLPACTVPSPGSFGGKVAWLRADIHCSPFTDPLYQGALSAQNAGAVAVVCYGEILDFFPPVIRVPAGSPAIHIPVVSVSRLDAARLSGAVEITWHESVSLRVATGGLVSAASSWGPSPDLDLKPDLGAPGGFMRSTYPLERGAFANLAGTSMASAHVAGAAALLLEARPHRSPGAVRAALQNTAQPRPSSASPSSVESVHRQGAGMIDVAAAARASIRIEPAALALGESEAGPAVRALTLQNDSGTDATYVLTHQPALATGPDRFAPTSVSLSDAVGFSRNPVTIPAGGAITVEVTIAPDAGLSDRSLYGGYIVLTPQGEGQRYRVPYLGFKGDYQSVPTLTPTSAGYPWLARERAIELPVVLIKVSDGWTFTLTGINSPWVRWHLDHPASLVRLEVFDAVTGRSWHRIGNLKWPGWNSQNGSFTIPRWPGTTVHGERTVVVPDGEYVIELSALRALGDADDPSHWEHWTSPRFFIDRPNLVVERVGTTESVVQPADDVTILASIHNQSRDPHAVVVTVLDDDMLLHEETLDLEPGQTRVVEAPWHVSAPTTHRIRVTASHLEGEESYEDNQAELSVTPGEPTVGVANSDSRRLELAPARPNPFAGNVSLAFSLPEPGPARVEVFDLQGRRLRVWGWAELEAGGHFIAWDGRCEDGRSAPAGALLYRLTAMGRTITRKAVRIP